MEDHDAPLCAALGHFIGQVLVVYCPHQQRWTAFVRSGDDADDGADFVRHVPFGPFDSADDVADHLGSHLAELVRVRSRVWLEARRARR